MGEIGYIKSTAPTLEHKLAEDVYKVVSKSFRHANQQYDTYTQEGLEAFLEGYKPEEIRSLFLPPIVSVFAYDGERLVGTGFLGHGKFPKFVHTGDEAFVYGLYVDPDYQKQGIGMNILNIIVDHAGGNNIKTIQGLSTDFPSVLERYLKFGFKKLGEVEFGQGHTVRKFHEIELDLTKT